MSEPFLGEIKMVSFTYAPAGWAICDGTLLPIQQNQALYSLLFTSFGGDGRTTFALPDMRGRVPVSIGQHPVGYAQGTELVPLSIAQIPSHSHTVNATSAAGDRTSIGVDGTALYATGNYSYGYTSSTSTTAMNQLMIEATGGGQSHNNIQPCLVINYCIAITGTYPQRS